MNRPVILAIAACHRDAELAGLWLKWVSFLAEQPGGSMKSVDCLVMLTMRISREQEESLRASVGTGRSNAPRTIFVRCTDEIENAYPKSASHLFLRTLETAEKLYAGSPVLWCEPDTVPMKPTWFSEIAAEYQTCGQPFLGSRVGKKHIQMSGVAVYPHDWRARAPKIADVLFAPDLSQWGIGKGMPWDVFARDQVVPHMAESKLMKNVWKQRDVFATPLKDIPASCCLFHQDKIGHLCREIASLRYPEFMASLPSPRRFYFLNGHPSRLRAKGVRIRFSYSTWNVGGHRSAVCSDELDDDEAGAMAALVGQLGVREIDEKEFLRITGRETRTLPPPRLRGPKAGPVADSPYSHPSVFVMLGRYGDICNVLPMMKAEADAGRRPTLVVSQGFADILDGVSYVDRIVWDGDYDRLPDALRWLRKEKGIMSPVVAQYHRNPHDRSRFTPSYQTEVWRLAGRLPEFATRRPLEFDRRDTERERALVWKVLGERDDAPLLILVGLESVSSPLNGTAQIMAAIRRRFEPKCIVVDLASVKAERIYDLIGLLDAASLLITADTVFLHLARASKVTTVAIVNDGWRGSVAEHSFQTIRYAAANPNTVVSAAEKAVSLMPTPAAEGQGDTLTTIVWPRPPITPEAFADMGNIELRAAQSQPAIIHVADVFGSSARHHAAQATWEAAYSEVITPMPFRDGPRNAKDELGDPRPLPFLKDVLWSAIPADATARGSDIVVWSNGDVGLKPGLAAVLRDHIGKHHAASMRRTESNGKGHPGRDLFAFTVDWLHTNWDQIPDYVLGAPVFDLGLVAMIRKFHGLPFSLKSCNEDLSPADMTPGYALHESHAPEWQVANMDSIPSVRHNKRIFKEWADKHWPELKFTKGGNLR